MPQLMQEGSDGGFRRMPRIGFTDPSPKSVQEENGERPHNGLVILLGGGGGGGGGGEGGGLAPLLLWSSDESLRPKSETLDPRPFGP